MGTAAGCQRKSHRGSEIPCHWELLLQEEDSEVSGQFSTVLIVVEHCRGLHKNSKGNAGVLQMTLRGQKVRESV